MKVHLSFNLNFAFCNKPPEYITENTQEVTCLNCINAKITEHKHELSEWTKRLAELQQTVPKEFEQVFKDNFNDILA